MYHFFIDIEMTSSIAFIFNQILESYFQQLNMISLSKYFLIFKYWIRLIHAIFLEIILYFIVVSATVKPLKLGCTTYHDNLNRQEIESSLLVMFKTKYDWWQQISAHICIKWNIVTFFGVSLVLATYINSHVQISIWEYARFLV